MTAGNASSINDAAAAVVLMERELAEAAGLAAAWAGWWLTAMPASIRSTWASVRCRPSGRCWRRPDCTLNDIDVFEVNEAFAAQALAVCRELELPMDRTNPNGSGISLGHPIGATGCILDDQGAVRIEAHRRPPRLVTMCIGGGQGIAALF